MSTPSSAQSVRALHRPAGFGLVEVLVAMAIGMIGILAITQTFATNERYKENVVGTSGAQTNGSISLFTLERDIRQAGFGIASTGALGCSSVQYQYNGAYSNPPGGGTGVLPAFTLAPITITQGAGDDPDTITTLSSSNAYRTIPARLTYDMAATSIDIRVSNGTGFALGDLLVATQGTTCTMMEVTTIVDAATHFQRAQSGAYNPDGASNLPAFTIGAQIYTLGRPQMRRYTVNNNNLTVADWNMVLAATTPTVVVDEIVDLQAEYGLDNGANGGTAADGVIDTYSTTTPASATEWQQLQAIRLAVLARGSYERPGTNGVCTITAAVPTWAGSQQSPLHIVEALPSCYRYRVFETIVPVRNLIWREDRT